MHKNYLNAKEFDASIRFCYGISRFYYIYSTYGSHLLAIREDKSNQISGARKEKNPSTVKHYFPFLLETALSWSLEGVFDRPSDPLYKEVPTHSQEKLTQSLILCLLKHYIIFIEIGGCHGLHPWPFPFHACLNLHNSSKKVKQKNNYDH